MINYHANYQSTLFSFNQGSLYCRSGKASPAFLVKSMAMAIVYLNAEIDTVLARIENDPSTADDIDDDGAPTSLYCAVLLRDLVGIDRKARELGLTLQVAKQVDTLRRQGFLQPRK